MAYDERGNVLKITDALNHSSTFNYDLLNRMTKATNALGFFTQYQYDILDRTIQATSGEGRVIKYAYDANSNLLSVTDPAGNVTRYDYDRKDRMIKRTDASGKIETYQYDGNDNLVKNNDRKGQVTTYQYDANDRLVSTTYNDGKVVSNTYDGEDRLVSLNDTAPGAGQHNFTYDLLDRLTKESTPRGTVSYAYDVLGRRTSLKINNQRNLNYSYDDNNRLTAITEGNESFGFSYDQLDRRAGMTLPNGISTAYNYDAAGRLTGMKYSKGSQILRDLTYGYDEINRRIAYSGNTAPAPRDTATDTVTVNALNQYTSRNSKPVSHDDNANQTINNAVWDARDRLISLSGPNFTASFTYDAMGRRTSKTVNGQTKTYLYDGSDLISETGADYTFGPGIDEPLERKSGQNEYYLSDALGSVIGLADSNGAIKTSYNYSPFGKKQTTGTNSSNPFAFTGREDDGTGLYYYRARYYSPDQKRFIAADPLGFGGGDSNFYAYVGNNPINFTDPTGESFESFAQGLAVGGATGLVSTFVITAALTASGVTIGPLIGAVLLLGGGAALIAAINEIANEPCPDKRDYLLGTLIGGAVGGGLGAKLGGGLGAGLRAKGGGGAPCSFVEGTSVQTKDGPKPIEKVKPEDSVLARNEKTGAQSYHKVSQTFATPNDEIYDLELTRQDGKSDVLGVTGNHPFWLKGKGWTESDLLKAGDLVAGKNGTWLKVSKLTLRTDKQTAYNLEVEQDHTYFVGLAGAWVHNACKILKANSEASGPHSVFKVNPQTGKVSSYETFKPQTNPRNSNPWESFKRVDVEGRPHFNKVTQEYVPTPHAQSRKIPGGVRPAMPREIPR